MSISATSLTPRTRVTAPGRAVTAEPKAPLILSAALLVLMLYAVFAHGAASATADARVQVATAVVAALAGGAWLMSGTLQLRAPRLAYGGVALLAVFALWSAISLAWSVAPEQTWLEFNRALDYVLVLLLAIMLGSSHPRAVELVARGFLALVLLVTAYALGQKLLPGLRLDGIVNLNHTGPLPRLQEPFGYWNALGLFVAMGVPIALALTVDRVRSPRARLCTLVALSLMFATIGFTYSRGAIVALVIALAVGVPISRARLRAQMWLALALLGSVPPLVLGLTLNALSNNGVGLGRREGAGALLTGVTLAAILLLLLAGRRVLEIEHRVRLSAERGRLIKRGLLAATAIAVVLAVGAVSLSSRGLGGTVSNAWHSFTTTHYAASSDPQHLLSVDSANRWVWWKEAVGAFSDRPLTGWGAGSFAVVHLLYRPNRLTVNQPHSVPLQWLAELGLVGAISAIVAFGLLLAAGIRTVLRRALSTERLLAAGLVGGAVAYLVHALFDWDWNIPGVTLPALVLLGVLAGSRHREAPGSRRLAGPGPGARSLSLAALTLCLCAFTLSVVIPQIASSKASTALVAAGSTSPGALEHAQSAAALAASLDPLSDAGVKVQATLALRQGNVSRAHAYLLSAIARDPSDVQAWEGLAGVDLGLGDRADALAAMRRILALDPRDRGLVSLLAATLLHVQPPASQSATATPLPQS